MSAYVFPGYPSFLESAAAELGLPRSAGPAGQIAALTALANLCAQAALGDLAYVPDILNRATEFRDQLAVALRASEMMLADVESGRAQSAAEDRAVRDTPPCLASSPEPRKARKGLATSRESS